MEIICSHLRANEYLKKLELDVRVHKFVPSSGTFH